MLATDNTLFASIKEIILKSREQVFRAANSALLLSYWEVGRLIVEDEQKGFQRAEYGKNVLKKLSIQLTLEFGKGFDYTNLTNMRKFYLAFPILDALRQELSWTHYSSLLNTDHRQTIDGINLKSVKHSVLNENAIRTGK